MDKLKKYLQDNRPSLDVHEPKEDGFNNIIDRLGTKKSGKKRHFLWLAASIVFVFILFNLRFILMDMSKDENQLLAEKAAKESVVSKPVEQKDTIEFNVNKVTAIRPGITKIEKKAKHATRIKMLAQPEVSQIDSILLVYNQMVSRYLDDITTDLAGNRELIGDVNNQLQQMEKDEQRIKNLVQKFGAEENLLEALIRLNQQKIIYLKRIKQPLLKRKQYFESI